MPDSVSDYAAEGTLAHSIGELKLRKRFTTDVGPRKYNSELKKLQALPLYSPEMESCTDEYLAAANEIALAFPEIPYVALEQRVDYSTWVPEGFGTSDCVMVGNGLLHIIDYKHGKGVPVSAEDNPQMKLYALGAWSRYSLLYDIQRVRWSIVQPRNGGVSDAPEMPIADLQKWAEGYVKPLAELAAEGKGEYCPGEWCRFCRAKAVCRARSDHNLALEGFNNAPAPTLSPAEIGDALTRALDLKSWLSELEGYALSEILAGREVPGWKAVEGRATRTWTDQDAAFEAAKAAGTPEAMLYERRAVTLAALEKVMGKKTFQVLSPFIAVPPGKPALAPENDKRPAITNHPSAEDDFKAEEN